MPTGRRVRRQGAVHRGSPPGDGPEQQPDARADTRRSTAEERGAP